MINEADRPISACADCNEFDRVGAALELGVIFVGWGWNLNSRIFFTKKR